MDLWLHRIAEGIAIATPGIAVLMAILKWFLGQMTAIAKKVDDLGQDVAVIKSQVENNGGKSLKDAVERVDDRTEAMANALGQLTGRFDEHVSHFPPEQKGRRS